MSDFLDNLDKLLSNTGSSVSKGLGDISDFLGSDTGKTTVDLSGLAFGLYGKNRELDAIDEANRLKKQQYARDINKEDIADASVAGGFDAVFGTNKKDKKKNNTGLGELPTVL